MSNLKFSRRFAWDTGTNALGRLMAEKQRQGRVICDLTQSNPTRVGLDYPVQSILSALSSEAAMVYAPDSRGLDAARHAIAGYYQNIGQALKPEHLFLTANTSEAYSMLFKLLADPGDEILIPGPGYPLLAYLAGFENLKARSYPLRYEDPCWSLDMEVLEALVTSRTRAIVAVNPNNPTGSYLSAAELAALDSVCGRYGLALIVDEVFFDFQHRPATRPVPSALNNPHCLTIVLNGLSKMLALPQVKLGWIALGGDENLVRRAGQGLEVLLDFYLSVGTPVQHAAADLLALRPVIQDRIGGRLDANARFMRERVADVSGCRELARQGGWYAVLEFADALTDEQRVVQLLEQCDTLVHPGFFYDFGKEGYVVVSLLPPFDQFQAGMDRLLADSC